MWHHARLHGARCPVPHQGDVEAAIPHCTQLSPWGIQGDLPMAPSLTSGAPRPTPPSMTPLAGCHTGTPLTSRMGTVTTVGTPAGGVALEKCSRKIPLPWSRTSGCRGGRGAPAGAWCVTVYRSSPPYAVTCGDTQYGSRSPTPQTGWWGHREAQRCPLEQLCHLVPGEGCRQHPVVNAPRQLLEGVKAQLPWRHKVWHGSHQTCT